MGWLETLLDSAASRVDRAALAALLWQDAGDTADLGELAHAQRLERLAAIATLYGEKAVEDAFFAAPGPIEPTSTRVRNLPGGGRVVDLAWRSGCVPWLADVRDAWLAHERNQFAHARMYVADKPRPAVILIHGYGSGHWRMEERLWPILELRSRGLDVVLPVLPLHGPRARAERPWPPPFPAADPRLTHEGFRQAIHDLRSLVGWLRARGHGHVGVMGMSLGGYTAGLLATVEPNLAFLAPVIPLGSLADFARQAGRLGRGAEMEAQHAALELAYRLVSPYARPSLVPPERVVILSAARDRITGPAHAERLHAHFGGELVQCRGGHLMQHGLGEGYKRVGGLIERLGIV